MRKSLWSVLSFRTKAGDTRKYLCNALSVTVPWTKYMHTYLSNNTEVQKACIFKMYIKLKKKVYEIFSTNQLTKLHNTKISKK